MLNKLIGNTPMIKINYLYNNSEKSVYTKLEYYNLTGSIKDRMAFHIINEARKEGDITEHQPIIEATSGNTGISLAAIGAFYGHPVHIFLPDWVSEERRKILEMFGAKIYLVSKSDGGFLKAIELADELSEDINGFRPNQFKNNLNIEAHYMGTGKEIIDEMNHIGGFVSGIGTGGTLMGVGKRLREHDANIKVFALEPDSLPLLTTGKNTGSHKIEGIGDDFLPDIVDRDLIDDIILVNENDAINMSRKLTSELGLGVGISSGANFLASISASEKIDTSKNIVTVFPDDNKKYISTDLGKEVDTDSKFLSNKIKLLNYEIIAC